MALVGELLGGAVLGTVITDLYTRIKDLISKSKQFEPLVRDIQSKLESLQPVIEEIIKHNIKLNLSNVVIESCKKQMEEGIKMVDDFSSAGNKFNFKKRKHTKQLQELDASLKQFLAILDVQGLKDGKETLGLVRELTDVHVERILERMRKDDEDPQLTVGSDVKSMLIVEGNRETTLKKLEHFRLERVEALSNSHIRFSATLLNLVEIKIEVDNITTKKLPDKLCELIRLKKFCFTSFHKLSTLPEEIGNLINLEVLRLKSCTDLQKLPDSLTKLKNLHSLDISECFSINQLPEDIGALSSLKELNMSHCSKLHQLPLSVVFLDKLEGVTCDEDTKQLWEPYLSHLENLRIKVDLAKQNQGPSQSNLIVIRMQEREVMRNMMKSHFSTEDFKEDIRAIIRKEFADIIDCYGYKKQKNQDGEGTSKIELEGTNSSEPTRLSALMDCEIQAREWTLRKFNAWIDNPDAGLQNLEIFQASKEWFQDLMTTGMWLSESHINVFLHFVRMNTRHQPQPFSLNCTILDTSFWSFLNDQWETFKCNPDSYIWDSDVMDYALGKSLKYSRPWSDVDSLYLPVNIKDHWIAVCVELMKRKLTIYDPVCSLNQDYRDMLKPMAKMLPSLLIQSGFYAQRTELSPLSKPFEVMCSAAANIPQLPDRGDCGVFMLKFVEYLSLGKPLNFTQADIPLFRKRMALDMFTIGDDSG